MKKLLLSCLICLLPGCGSFDFPAPSFNTPPADQPRINIQAVNHDPAHISPEQWAGQVEAVNSQLQNEFRQDWGENSVLIITPLSQYDSSRPALHSVEHFPDPLKELNPNISGYHVFKNAYTKSTLPNWRRTSSHETMELVCDESILSLLVALRKLFGIAPLEIADPVESNTYAAVPGGPKVLSDYVTPAWFKLGTLTFSIDGKPRYDHLFILSSPGEVAPGGVRPKMLGPKS